jgi:hypothetical protein
VCHAHADDRRPRKTKSRGTAAINAFITTRIGDVPTMFGFFALIAVTGFTTINIPATTKAIASGEASSTFVLIAALLLFGGAMGKSAQFPLHVWLPDPLGGSRIRRVLVQRRRRVRLEDVRDHLVDTRASGADDAPHRRIRPS